MKTLHKSLKVLVTGADGFGQTDSISWTHITRGNLTQLTDMVVGNDNSVSPLLQYLTFPSLPDATNAKSNKKLQWLAFLQVIKT